MAGWKTLALNRVELLESEISALKRSGVVVPNALETELTGVRNDHGLNHSAWTSHRTPSFSGDERNHAWDEIHRVETQIAALRPSFDDVVDVARNHANERLPKARLKRFEEELKSKQTDDEKKALALQIIREAHAASAAKHEGERQRLRGLLALSVLLLVGAGAMVLLQWRAFPADPVIAAPPGVEGLSAWTTLSVVLMMGMFGGAFSALMSLYLSNKAFPDTYWFDPRPGLTLLKLSVGAWAAFLGVVAVASEVVVGSYTNFASLVFLSFLFGYGQQALTGLLDKRLETLAT